MFLIKKAIYFHIFLFSLVMYVLEVVRLEAPALDKHLISLARLNNKTVEGVETAAEQCRAFNSLSDTLSVVTLNSTLFYLEETMRTGTRLLLSGFERQRGGHIDNVGRKKTANG